MKKNKVFLVIVILFVLSMILFTWYFSSVTTKPWDKKKNNVPGKFKVK